MDMSDSAAATKHKDEFVAKSTDNFIVSTPSVLGPIAEIKMVNGFCLKFRHCKISIPLKNIHSTVNKRFKLNVTDIIAIIGKYHMELKSTGIIHHIFMCAVRITQDYGSIKTNCLMSAVPVSVTLHMAWTFPQCCVTLVKTLLYHHYRLPGQTSGVPYTAFLLP